MLDYWAGACGGSAEESASSRWAPVHLDTIALSSIPAATTTADDHHVGNIMHSVGGSAYNVAANLASQLAHQRAVREVAIYSILPEHSVLTEIFRYRIEAAGIDTRFVRLYREFKNSACAGIRAILRR